jgi:hypothetical protein
LASSRVVMVRMNKDLSTRFEHLRREFEGLPPSTIVRMAVTAVLALPLHEQIRIIESQVRHPGKPVQHVKRAGRSSINANKSRE